MPFHVPVSFRFCKQQAPTDPPNSTHRGRGHRPWWAIFARTGQTPEIAPRHRPPEPILAPRDRWRGFAGSKSWLSRSMSRWPKGPSPPRILLPPKSTTFPVEGSYAILVYVGAGGGSSGNCWASWFHRPGALLPQVEDHGATGRGQSQQAEIRQMVSKCDKRAADGARRFQIRPAIVLPLWPQTLATTPGVDLSGRLAP